MTSFKKQVRRKEIPSEFSEATRRTVQRIDQHQNVIGVFYLSNESIDMYTVPENMAMFLKSRLPPLSNAIRHAVAEITSSLNTVNPIVDRMMDDESVEGVIMTNKEGTPILTNITLTGATNYGLKLQQLGLLTQMHIKNMDPFDEILIVRLHTKKLEIILAPNSEFSIVVLQHARHKIKGKAETKKKNSKK